MHAGLFFVGSFVVGLAGFPILESVLVVSTSPGVGPLHWSYLICWRVIAFPYDPFYFCKVVSDVSPLSFLISVIQIFSSISLVTVAKACQFVKLHRINFGFIDFQYWLLFSMSFIFTPIRIISFLLIALGLFALLFPVY